MLVYFICTKGCDKVENRFHPGIEAEIVNCDKVNVRSKTSDGKYIEVAGHGIRCGKKVILLDYDPKSGRYKIDYKGNDGYIYKDYVKF